jgi:hypothetical protein
MAAYFALPKEGEDPPVYFYNESSEEGTVVRFEKFSAFLLDDMKCMAEPLPELHEAEHREG